MTYYRISERQLTALLKAHAEFVEWRHVLPLADETEEWFEKYRKIAQRIRKQRVP